MSPLCLVQVTYHPYMAAGTEDDVVKNHESLALKMNPLHSRIRANLTPVFVRLNAKARKQVCSALPLHAFVCVHVCMCICCVRAPVGPVVCLHLPQGQRHGMLGLLV